MAKQNRLLRAETALRDYALTFPEAHEDFPWGHRALKVKGKAFLFLSNGKGGADMLSLSVKLPVSGAVALSLPFASPTEYGLGKSGWVTARFNDGDGIPLDMLKEWVNESFRAIAPKRVLARLEDTEGGGPPRAKGSAHRRSK
jgi:predicted DNA-binding protein (MmcQ/YjbR family)